MTSMIDAVMTSDQLLALPDDGIERELIGGRLKEKTMTRRNRRHSRTQARITAALERWLDAIQTRRGEVLAGEVAFRLSRNPDTTVGIDVAYISAELAAATDDDTFLIDGIPVLAVEILSPSDTHEDVSDKIEEYLRVGVAQVWLADPAFRTITVYRPDSPPVLFNASQKLDGGAELPGLSALVNDLFV